MGKPRTYRYSARRKAGAVELYRTEGPQEAARRTKIPARTIGRWARKAGVETEVVSETTKATEAARAKVGLIRAQLLVRLWETAADLLERVHEPHTERTVTEAPSGTTTKTTLWPKPTAVAVQAYLMGVGIAIDKARQEMGETTGRQAVEHSGGLAVGLGALSDEDLNKALARALAALEG